MPAPYMEEKKSGAEVKEDLRKTETLEQRFARMQKLFEERLNFEQQEQDMWARGEVCLYGNRSKVGLIKRY